ncbi:hypothetical protein [Roseovarius gahaiensis]|nr:hypothetical protein [Roseovarius gahaiensis]
MTVNVVIFHIGDETIGADRGALTCLTAPLVGRIVWSIMDY